jgi:predicted branched-subunit amino acid permease
MGTDQDARRAVVRDSLGVAIATGTYGLSFGAVGVASGLDVAQTCALSLVMFTGASQFALVGVLGSGGTPLAGALTALLLGTRNTSTACGWPRCSATAAGGGSWPPTCSSTSRRR